MKKLLKIGGIGLGLVVVALIAAAAYLAATFDPNAYRDRVGQLVEEQTGRTLVIAGDIGLAFFPWLAVELEDVTLGNAPGFGPEPFARLDRVDVRLRLLPLLRREVEAGAVVLRGLELNLARDAAGRTNWDDLSGDTEAELDRSGAAPLAALAIGGVDVVDARLVWDDRLEGVRHELRRIHLATGAIEPDQPIDLNLAFELVSSAPALQATVDLRTRLVLAAALDTLRMEGLTLRLDLDSQALPSGVVALELASLDSRAGHRLIDLNGLSLRADLRGDGLPGNQLSATARADAKVDLEAGTLAVAPLQLNLDETEVTGQVRMSDFSNPGIRFQLAVNGIDLDRYLAASRENDAGAGESASASEGGDMAIDLPVETLRGLDLAGDLTVGHLRVSGLRASEIAMTLNARNGVIVLHPATAQLYGGSWSGHLQLDVRQALPRFAVDESLHGVRLGPLLQDLLDDALLTGTATLNATLEARGNTVGALRSSLAGRGDFELRDGAVKGINVAEIIRNAEARLRGRPIEASDEPNQTDFAELRGSFTASGGVISNNDLYAQSPLARLNGRGTIDVGRERLDYRLDTTLVGTLEGQGGRTLEELRGVTLPIRIQGSFSQPRFTLDLGSVLESRLRRDAQEQVDRQVDEQRQQLQRQIDEGARDQLRRLLR